MKRNLLLSVVAVIFIAGVLFVSGNAEEKVRNYIESFGWEVRAEAVEVEKVKIPEPLDKVYRKYNIMLKKEGYNLEKYCGKKATRYTYEVLNHKFGKNVYANVLICEGEIIGADIMTRALGGFMHGIGREEYIDET